MATSPRVRPAESGRRHRRCRAGAFRPWPSPAKPVRWIVRDTFVLGRAMEHPADHGQVVVPDVVANAFRLHRVPPTAKVTPCHLREVVVAEEPRELGQHAQSVIGRARRDARHFPPVLPCGAEGIGIHGRTRRRACRQFERRRCVTHLTWLRRHRRHRRDDGPPHVFLRQMAEGLRRGRVPYVRHGRQCRAVSYDAVRVGLGAVEISIRSDEQGRPERRLAQHIARGGIPAGGSRGRASSCRRRDFRPPGCSVGLPLPSASGHRASASAASRVFKGITWMDLPAASRRSAGPRRRRWHKPVRSSCRNRTILWADIGLCRILYSGCRP